MNCRTEWQPWTDTLHIWLWTRDVAEGSIRILQHVEGDTWRDEVYQDGAEEIPPSIVLHSLWAKVLAKELAKLPNAEEATVGHLKDAVEVRDRLLRIVEHKMGAA